MIKHATSNPNATGNTGITPNVISYDILKGFVLMDRSKTFTAEQLATHALFAAALQDATIEVLPVNRIFPVMKTDMVVGNADNTEAVSMQKAEYGNVLSKSYGKITYQVTFGVVGKEFFDEISKFTQNTNLAVMLQYAPNIWLMKQSGTGAAGIPCQFIAETPKVAQKQAVTEYKATIVLDYEKALVDKDYKYEYVFPNEEAYNFASNLSGLHNCAINIISASASSLVIDVVREGDGVQLVTEYPTLASATALVLKNASGVAIVPTAVSVNGLNQIVITATITSTFSIGLQTPSVLIATPNFVGTKTTGGYIAPVKSGVTS